MSFARIDRSPLDPTDIAIIEALQADGRMAVSELGRRIGLSQPATSERVKRLEERGIIAGYGARIDAVRGANELHHDGETADDEDHVEHSGAKSTKVEQRGDRPRAGERRSEHLGADQDRGADDGDDIEPEDAASLCHCVSLSAPQCLRIRVEDQAHSGDVQRNSRLILRIASRSSGAQT